MKYYLGIDPGETTGVAVYRQGHPDEPDGFVLLDQIRHTEFAKWLSDLYEQYGDFEFAVYERFITYRQYAQRQVGSKQVASQVIGMLKAFASIHDTPLVEQGADILAIGYKWLNVSKSGRSHAESHKFDAAAHVFYKLVNDKKAEPINVKPIN